MKRRSAIGLIVVAALLLVAAVALRWVLRPETVGPQVLDMAGRALGLEITADDFDYRLRGSPQLVARGVSAREPGSQAPMLDAERILVAVPWSTLRARGADPVVTRIEADAPHVRLGPFLDWWTRRPRGEGPLPTLRDGLRVDRGRIDASGWSLRDIVLDLPHFAPDARLRAGLRGRYQAEAVQVPFNLQVAMTRPDANAGIGIAGSATPRGDGWRVPSRVVLSARLAAPGPGSAGADAGIRLQRLRLSAGSRYVSEHTVQRFALGLAAGGTFADGALLLQPAALALRGQDMIPHLTGTGRLGYGQVLEFDLAGTIGQWPQAWPALPPPIGDSDSPLPFELHYRGAASLADPLELRLARDQARFEGRLRVAEVASWIGDAAAGSPLPPLEGRVTVPHMEVAGARLHGVEVTIEDGPGDEGEQP